MGNMKTPGVYIVEKSAFPNSVVEAPTAIPVFIGITEKALNGKDSLNGKPWKISSMTEYLKYFGQGPDERFILSITKADTASPANCLFVHEVEYEETVAEAADESTGGDAGDSTESQSGKAVVSTKYTFTARRENEKRFTLYYQMMMFFANGGGACYIVSVGTYKENQLLNKDMVARAISALEKEQEITMVVIPEAVYSESWGDIQAMALAHCGKMQNRFAILDVQPRISDEETRDEQIKTFHTKIGNNNLSYGAAYYPWLETSLLADKDITADMFIWDAKTEQDFKGFFGKDSSLLAYANATIGELIKDTHRFSSKRTEFHGAMLQNWMAYQLMIKKVKEFLNLLPPSAAMAGIYTMVDNTRGVWKAPANVSVNYVNKPQVNLNNQDQEELNVPTNGKAINAIRTFIGEGIKVWGARTLDGNSLDWRYINVRRTMLFLEESVKNAARAYVFEPNDSNTWLNMKCMIGNFLRSVWKKGGLVGSTPEEAYSVYVGLGETMTPEDVLEGIMRITVLVAISHPAEFIEITFQQQMQKS